MAGGMRSDASSSTSGGSDRGETVVVDCGKRKASCGYCKSGARTSICHGLLAHSLTVDDYQGLLDRGWRRSGCYLYKPEMERTCCPSYTIRLRATNFLPSKEQLRVSRRIQRFLDGGLECKKPGERTEVPNASSDLCGHALDGASTPVEKDSCKMKESEEDLFMLHLSDKIDEAIHVCAKRGELPDNVQFPRASVKRVSKAKRKLLIQGSKDLIYSCNVAFQLLASIRRGRVGEKNVQKLPSPECNAAENGFSPQVIAEKLVNCLSQIKELSGFSISACNGHINFYSAKGEATFPDSAQKAIISQEAANSRNNKVCSMEKSSKYLSPKRRKLEIRLKRSSFDPEEYALYRRYQLVVHNDTIDHVTESSYMRFLVETPLKFVPSTGDGTVPPCGFGSFHQQYVIDGKLVAVGVVDILPRCLSSKYLFWDPDFASLSLGKYSALQEIDWVRQTQTHCASLQYYYLGYYIHNCRKMRYKATYSPSELLCPLRYRWVPYDVVKPLLDQNPYVVLSDFSLQQNGESTPLCNSVSVMDPQHDEILPDELNDANMDEDGETTETYSDGSDDDLETESSGLVFSETEDGDITNILIGIRGSRMRYKDIQQAIVPTGRIYLENRLLRYKRVVGEELSKRIVYSLE